MVIPSCLFASISPTLCYVLVMNGSSWSHARSPEVEKHDGCDDCLSDRKFASLDSNPLSPCKSKNKGQENLAVCGCFTASGAALTVFQTAHNWCFFKKKQKTENQSHNFSPGPSQLLSRHQPRAGGQRQKRPLTKRRMNSRHVRSSQNSHAIHAMKCHLFSSASFRGSFLDGDLSRAVTYAHRRRSVADIHESFWKKCPTNSAASHSNLAEWDSLSIIAAILCYTLCTFFRSCISFFFLISSHTRGSKQKDLLFFHPLSGSVIEISEALSTFLPPSRLGDSVMFKSATRGPPPAQTTSKASIM